MGEASAYIYAGSVPQTENLMGLVNQKNIEARL